ncbi:MAG TPA: hypothetical protein VJN18_35680 [Polyangiaceae bacterium]|nr:hypothetical protein [Polyangiaceae bacterium]
MTATHDLEVLEQVHALRSAIPRNESEQVTTRLNPEAAAAIESVRRKLAAADRYHRDGSALTEAQLTWASEDFERLVMLLASGRAYR